MPVTMAAGNATVRKPMATAEPILVPQVWQTETIKEPELPNTPAAAATAVTS